MKTRPFLAWVMGTYVVRNGWGGGGEGGRTRRSVRRWRPEAVVITSE